MADHNFRWYGSTGLGLAICKNLVELMGGEIGAESTLDSGSMFFFTIVLGIGQTDTAVTDYSNEVIYEKKVSVNLDGIKLLLVEDNAFNQQVAFELLKKAGKQRIGLFP